MEAGERILGMLARGDDLGESEIASELGIDTQGLTAMMAELQREGRVTRTAGGKWRLTPATQATTDPLPRPQEPARIPRPSIDHAFATESNLLASSPLDRAVIGNGR